MPIQPRPCGGPLAYREKHGAKTARPVKSAIRSAGQDAAANADRQKIHPAETQAPPSKCSQTNRFIPLLAEYQKAPVRVSTRQMLFLRPIRIRELPARHKSFAPPERLHIAPGSPSACRRAQRMRRARFCRVCTGGQHVRTPHSSASETPLRFRRRAARQAHPQSRPDTGCRRRAAHIFSLRTLRNHIRADPPK